MTNQDVLELFINKRSGHTLNLRTNGSELINYDTCIAKWVVNEIAIDLTKYSRTTTRIVNKLKELLDKSNIKYYGFSF